MEVCCLGLFTCWIHPFATSRERAGVMACLPSAAMLGAAVLVNVLMSVVNLVQFQIPYQTCLGGNSQYIKDPCFTQNLFGWQTDKNCNPCYPEYSAMVRAPRLDEPADLMPARLLDGSTTVAARAGWRPEP